jgi:Raf kinase inhibitor-like YbhB/YbcL family protein
MTTQTATQKVMTITSSAFENNGEIPDMYSGFSKDQSWPISWSGVPAQAQSLVLIVHDPDAPRGDFVHWVLYNIPPSTAQLASGVAPEELPHGTLMGKNDFGHTGFNGPKPPKGTHRYITQLIALDAVLEDLHFPTREQLMNRIQGHVIATAEYVGTFAAR